MKNMNETEKLMAMVQEVNSWNGELESLNVWENDDDFFNTFFGGDPMEVARSISFGDYNYNDEYVAFNGYGNLVSYNEYQVEKLLKDFEEEIIESYNELVEDGSIDDYLSWFKIVAYLLYDIWYMVYDIMKL